LLGAHFIGAFVVAHILKRKLKHNNFMETCRILRCSDYAWKKTRVYIETWRSCFKSAPIKILYYLPFATNAKDTNRKASSYFQQPRCKIKLFIYKSTSTEIYNFIIHMLHVWNIYLHLLFTINSSQL